MSAETAARGERCLMRSEARALRLGTSVPTQRKTGHIWGKKSGARRAKRTGLSAQDGSPLLRDTEAGARGVLEGDRVVSAAALNPSRAARFAPSTLENVAAEQNLLFLRCHIFSGN